MQLVRRLYLFPYTSELQEFDHLIHLVIRTPTGSEIPITEGTVGDLKITIRGSVNTVWERHGAAKPTARVMVSPYY